MEETARRVESIQAAFKKLNKKYVVHGSTMAELLTIGGPNTEYAESILNTHRPFQGMPVLKHRASWTGCSLNTAAGQIEKLKRATERLQAAFEVMHQTTIYALVESRFDYNTTEKLITTMLDTTDKATKFINDWKKKSPELASAKTGRRKSKIAFHIAMILADEYHRATGKPPAVATDANKRGYPAYGDFLTLIKTVFKALDIKESPESMARDAKDLWLDCRDIQNALEKATIQSNPDFRIKRRSLPKEKSPSKNSD